jgi:mRNA-degrading endonuclease RelE of RelBE toxin-antitoxin system
MALMQAEPPAIQVELTPRFQRDLRTLVKRYRHIQQDIQPLIDQLQAGELPGDRISGMDYTVFKVRLKNSDIQKGKSAGYRIIYSLKMSDRIVLVTLYSKSDQSDITAEDVRDILTQFESRPAQPKEE